MDVNHSLIVKIQNQALENTGQLPQLIIESNTKQQNGKIVKDSEAEDTQKGKNNKLKPEAKVKELEDKEDLDSKNESVRKDPDEMDDTLQNKGVKILKELRDCDSDTDEDDDNPNSDDSLDDINDDNDDNNDDNGDEEESEPGLKAPLCDSLADNDDEDDESDDDSDISDNDEAVLDSLNTAENDKESDHDQDNNDLEDDDKVDNKPNEEEKSSLGLQVLLGDNLIGKNDGNNFDGIVAKNKNDDISRERDDEDKKDKSIKGIKSKLGKKSKKKKRTKKKVSVTLSRKEKEEKDSRTIYIGNIPKGTSEDVIKELLRPYGEVESVWIGGVIPKQRKVSKKAKAVLEKMDPGALTIYAHVYFKDTDSPKQALALHGHKLGENHLRVDLAKSKSPPKDENKTAYVEKLPFEFTEEDVRAYFVACGEIDFVRIIRNRYSGLSKGFGFVHFENEDSVALAVKLNGTIVNERKLKVKICNNQAAKSKKEAWKKRVQKKMIKKNRKIKNVEGNVTDRGQNINRNDCKDNDRENRAITKSLNNLP